MDYFQSHTLRKAPNSEGDYELVLQLDDYLFEFASELGDRSTLRQDIITYASGIIANHYQGIKITAIKVMIGGVVMSGLPFINHHASAETPITQSNLNIYYVVAAGDSLWKLSKKYSISVDQLKIANKLKNDTLQIGQKLIIPKAIHVVKKGDTLFHLSRTYGTTVEAIKMANLLSSTTLAIGRNLIIPSIMESKAAAPSVTPVKQTPVQPTNNITYKTHTVQSGDTIWDLSITYGIPQAELIRENNLTGSSALTVGQQLKIPVHQIAVKSTVSPSHGELLDWWTEAQYVFPIGKTAKVTDVATGKTFTIKRTIGANHADSETLTVTDSNFAKSIWGGFSWNARAVVIEVDGRKLAASMSFFPHEREYIMNNGISGHFDVYFSGSTRHVDGKADPYHQKQVEIAAGVR